ncbi:MAG: hypothetical protein JWL90_2552 [Chthoniobacteraceae bacterium]|nr:hypothetical protein [Chthoniobacteraceae bacterium]
MNSFTAFRLSAGLGFLAVALGAFGAHNLQAVLLQNNALEIWKTAALYHLLHAAVLLFIASREPLQIWAWRLMFGGVLIFSGSLYILALSNVRWLGAITPLGGLGLLAGWLLLAIKGRP